MIKFIKDDLLNGPLRNYIIAAIGIFLFNIDYSMSTDQLLTAFLVTALLCVPLAISIACVHTIIKFILHIICDAFRK